MKLTTALDEFGLLQRRRLRGEEGQRASLALDALREFLVDHSGFEETARVTSEELFQFLLDYYPSQEQPDGDVALALLDTAAGFARWLLERGERAPLRFAEAEEGLREDLPRAMEALALLREHAHADDLTPQVPVSYAGDEDSAPEEDLGSMTSGLERMVSLDKIDYHAAQLDYFTVRRTEVRGEQGLLALESSSREILREGLADPVRVPARAAGLLRPDDILYAEIAPAPSGWELLEAFGVRPGGYD